MCDPDFYSETHNFEAMWARELLTSFCRLRGYNKGSKGESDDDFFFCFIGKLLFFNIWISKA